MRALARTGLGGQEEWRRAIFLQRRANRPKPPNPGSRRRQPWFVGAIVCASARRPLALSSDCAMRQACPLGKPCILARISLGKGWGPREHKQVGEKATQGKGRCVVPLRLRLVPGATRKDPPTREGVAGVGGMATGQGCLKGKVISGPCVLDDHPLGWGQPPGRAAGPRRWKPAPISS